MQPVDSKLYSANMAAFSSSDNEAMADRRWSANREHRYDSAGRAYIRNRSNLISRLASTSASERLLALLLAAFVLTASPALLATVTSTVSLSLRILLQVGHAGFIAFQIFGR
jgi:hypothetical protein